MFYNSWKFPSNNYGEIQGINNAGIETFSATKYESLIRESIQNSLDAKRKNIDGPVIVKIAQEHIYPKNIPGYDSLVDAFARCVNVKNSDEKTVQFFNKAYSNLIKTQNKINLLKVSDFNTTGLSGGKEGVMGSSWSRLVKEAGTSNKAVDAGGSFGIGKSAYFACSNMRTVFFSSLSEEGEKSNVGVSKLISFDLDNDEKTTGTGYYARSEKLLAFEELATFDNQPERNEPGTDIYIFDYAIDSKVDSLSEKLCYYVISNFLISILTGKLVVYIGSEIVIDITYVDNYFAKFRMQSREELTQEEKELLDYYTIFKNEDNKTVIITLESKEYGSLYGFEDGECTLYLRKGDDFNRSILVTRKTGMKIYLQKNISSSIIFSGILYVSGPNMNKFFRAMETPAHDKWIPSEQSDLFDVQKKAFSELKKYIKNKVVFFFEDKIGDEFDAFDAGQFLPDLLIESDTGALNGKIPNFMKDNVTISMKTMKPSKKILRQTNLLKDEDIFNNNEEGDDIEYGGNKTGTGINPGKGTIHDFGNRKGNGLGTGDNEGDGTSSEIGDENLPLNGENVKHETAVENKKYKEAIASRRVICIDSKAGLYNINIVIPNKAKNSRIEFSLAGEQSDEKLDVRNAKVVLGSANIVKSEENKIYLENLNRGEKITLSVEFNFKDYCMMEVGYYESKK